MARQVDGETIELIKYFESWQPKAYQDPVGIWTVGWGHTQGVRKGMEIDQKTGERLLREDLGEAEACVEGLVRVCLNPGQFGSLVSFTFNCGTEAFRGSTLLRQLNRGKRDKVPGELARWVRGSVPGEGLVVLPGLVRRRRAEGALWLGADWRKAAEEEA